MRNFQQNLNMQPQFLDTPPSPPPHFASAPLLFLAKIFRTLPTQKIKNKIKINQSILEKSYRPLYERGGEAVQTMFKYLKGG